VRVCVRVSYTYITLSCKVLRVEILEVTTAGFYFVAGHRKKITHSTDMSQDVCARL